jgi:SAM-dependent methyltransferase
MSGPDAISIQTSTSDWCEGVMASDGDLLRGLPFATLARVPPPKREGLPLGHELRILAHFLGRGTSSLDPSALTWAYTRLLGARDRLLFRALVLREPLPEARWDELLGPAVRGWRERGLLAAEQDALRCRFIVVPVADMLFAVDPQEDAFPGKVHLGQDSLGLLRFVSTRMPAPGARVLDVGTGSGILLCGVARAARPAVSVGLDINPRAVRAARFNAVLNGLEQASLEARDVFAPWQVEPFDLVMWNAPFVFLPESERARNLDGYGGELGIQVTLTFLERLPELLGNRGLAIVMTAGPVFENGENRLASELRKRCARLRLDAMIHVGQSFWNPSLKAFHAGHGIDNFESVILELRRGSGIVGRRSPGWMARASSSARGLLYRLGWNR